MTFIPQFEPLYGEAEKQALMAYLDSGGWLTEFQKTRDFEEEIKKLTGSHYAWIMANGTVSLTCALYALGITRPDQEVIVPNFTMVASPNSVLLAGATPILVDIDEKTLCITPETIEPHLTERTKVIMHVSLNGRSGDMERLVQFCRDKGLILLEDAAQAFGSYHRGQHLGTFGAIGSFSFSMPKIITTGQGGALISADESLMQKVQRIRDFGRVRGGIDEYEMIGFNFKFSDLQAILGLEQMKTMPERIRRRRELFEHYRQALKDVSEVHWIDTDLNETTPWFVDVLVPDPKALIDYLKTQGIGARPFYPALHTQAPYNEQRWDKNRFPISQKTAQHGLWLPSSLKLSDEQVDQIAQTIRSFYQSEKT